MWRTTVRSLELTNTWVGAIVRAVLEGVGAYCGPLNVENVEIVKTCVAGSNLGPDHAAGPLNSRT